MDPDEILKDIRELADLVRVGEADAAVVLANTVDDLDAWLSRGGFLPRAWHRLHREN